MILRLLKEILFYRFFWRCLILLITLMGAIFGILGPYLQKHFIDRILEVPSPSVFGLEQNASPITLLVISFICLLLSMLAGFLGNYIGLQESLYLQKKLSLRLYNKNLRLRSDGLKGRSIGEIVALYATDIPGASILIEQTLPIGASTLFPLLIAPLSLSLLYGMPIKDLLIIIGAIIIMNGFLASRQARFFMRFKQLAAHRLGLVNEWILNIKALKLLGWISPFEKKIQEIRIQETDNRVAMVTNGQTMNSVATTITFLINTLALYALINSKGLQSVTPGDLLSLLWILGVFLTRPFRQLPWLFTYTFDGWTSLKRLARFLELKNEGRDWSSPETSGDLPMAVQGPSIEVKNLNLTIGGEQRLFHIDLNIQPSEFVALVGEVGSGKSLLLLSLIGETGADIDVYRINHKNVLATNQSELCRHFSYVPQEGFVMSATLRENVLFDYETSQKMDSRVIEALEKAQFMLDPHLFPDQLDTEIGERGINLSGGQKQRINIARAHFYGSPIIIMDDSLSALDVNTEEELVETLLKNQWKNKTRILATHRLSVLKKVDRILFLADGRIQAEGSLDELLKTSAAFCDFVKTLPTDAPPPEDLV